MTRPITTLFLLSSIDGKLSTGKGLERDFDLDLPNMQGVKDGLQQYYDIECTTSLWSLCSGAVLSKIINLGIFKETDNKKEVNLVVIDNKNLSQSNIQTLCNAYNNIYLVTTNRNHTALGLDKNNLIRILMSNFDIKVMLNTLSTYNCKELTIQSGGTLNTEFIRSGCLDYIDLVVAPILVGGKETPTIADGASITDINELKCIKNAELQDCIKLNNSYLRLRYKIKKLK